MNFCVSKGYISLEKEWKNRVLTEYAFYKIVQSVICQAITWQKNCIKRNGEALDLYFMLCTKKIIENIDK